MNEKTLELNYKGFEDYLKIHYEDNIEGPGSYYIFHFTNGYGASVTKNSESRGYEDDLWEISILSLSSGSSWETIENSPIANDKLGFLTNDDVIKILDQISKFGGKGNE